MASGLFLVVPGARTVRADQMHPIMIPVDLGSGSMMSPTAVTPPTPAPASDLPDLVQDWHPTMMAMSVPPDVNGYSAATSGMTHPAADFLVPHGQGTPSVENWHHIVANACTPPPPPPCSMGSPGSSTTTPTSPLGPPSALQTSPTPAPEPSTILSAIALAGALAWSRRSRA